MRRQILENTRDALKSKILGEERIKINPGRDVRDDELPMIYLSSISEEVSVQEEAPRSYRRDFIFNVEIYLDGNDQTEANIDLENVIDLVEQSIESNEYLNSRQRATFLSRIEFDFISNEKVATSVGIMRYRTSRVLNAELDADCLNTLNTVNIKYKITDQTVEKEVDAEDNIKDLNL